MEACLFREGALQSLCPHLQGDDVVVLLVTGDSGVGKSTVIEAALQRLLLRERVAGYSLRDDNEGFSDFKSFLNDILATATDGTSSGDLEIDDVHVNHASALTSSSIRRLRPLIPLARTTARGVQFESSKYRLNGGDHRDFFLRLWSFLGVNKILGFHIANLEYAAATDLELVAALAQTAPAGHKLILEAGSLRNIGITSRLERLLNKACPKRHHRLHINPFDRHTAHKFYKAMKRRQASLPPFDFDRSNGNPFAIVYNLHQAEYGYQFSAYVRDQLDDSESRETLLILTLFYGLIDDHEFIVSIASAAKMSFSPGKLRQQGIVSTEDDKIFLTHALFRVYVATECRQEMSQVMQRLYPTIHERNRTIGIYLRLHHHHLFDNHGFDGRFTSMYLAEVVAALEAYDLKMLGLLLSAATTIRHYMTDCEQDALQLIDAQHSLYCGRLLPEHLPDTGSSRTGMVQDVLRLQHLYHANQFQAAIEFANGLLARTQTTPKVGDDELRTKCQLLALALRGVARISTGDYSNAREDLAAAAQGSDPSSNPAHYLRLLDSFVYGSKYVARLDVAAAGNVKNPYIRAKLCHNILSSKMKTEFRDPDVFDDLSRLVIEPLRAMQSREVSYPLNNVGIIHLANDRLEDAQAALLVSLDATYEVYDRLSCLVNLTVVSGLQRDWVRAHYFSTSALAFIDESRFRDPSFLTKAFLNSAVVACARGEWAEAEALLGRISVSSDYFDIERVRRKTAMVEDAIRSRSIDVSPTEAAHFADISVFWPQMIVFWDFTIPVVDGDLLLVLYPDLSSALKAVQKGGQKRPTQ